MKFFHRQDLSRLNDLHGFPVSLQNDTFRVHVLTDQEETVIQMAIVGRPNVGKSSLTNRLLGQDRTMVSDIPGTTRDAIDTEFTAEDGTVTPIDLPASDVLVYTLENGAKVIVRPSGTEPKMKLYISAKEDSAEKSDQLAEELEKATREAAGL